MFDSELAQANYQRLTAILGDTGELKTKLLLLRQLLESIYKKLSEDSKTSFNGIFARMQYVHSQLNFPPDIVSQVNKLRLLCNNVAHEEGFELTDTAYHSSIYALRILLVYLCPDYSDPVLEEYLAANKAQPFPDFTPTKKHSFHCVVSEWHSEKEGDTDCGITILAKNDEGYDCSITLKNMDTAGKYWSQLNKVLWTYCTLHCFNLSQIAGKPYCFISNPLTLIVVEPDFLIDASSVAECFTPQGYRPEYFIISRLLREASAEKATQGNIVNFMLDELISDPDQDYNALFRQSMSRQPISIVALGKEAALNIHHTIRDKHLKRIKEFALSIKDNSVQLEPSFINPDYGLQGRLDILYHNKGKQHIVELKSGNPPHTDVWIQHQMQVVAYNMIIRDCFPQTMGTSSILYSSAEENSLRHVVNTLQLEQNLLMCRNRIVGIMHGLATDPSVFFNWLMQNTGGSDTGFMQTNIQTITSTLRSISDFEYEWFLGHLRLLVREIWFEKTGGLGSDSIYGHNSLWQESMVAKRRKYRLLGDLKVESVTFNKVCFRFTTKELITDFRSDDIVILYRQNIPVNRQELLRGQITLIAEDTIEVQIRGGLQRTPDNFKDDLWALEHDILESALYSPLSSILSFLQSGAKQRQLFLGIKKPSYIGDIDITDDSLTGVIKQMVAAQEYCVIQGPPGTGKTSGLLSAYIKKLFTETEKNILILSFTNRAVDEICLNLRKQSIPFIRTGHSDAIDAELMDKQIAGKKFDGISEILKSNRVWVATVQSCNAWLNDMLKLIRIDEIIIDEASQIMENSILGIITKAEKCILIGDQNQLPPISRQSDQRFDFKHETLAGLCYGAYNQSLMERLNNVCKKAGWFEACAMLHKHYRMHDDIAGLIQGYYYDSLISSEDRQKATLPQNAYPLFSSRLVWIECPPSLHAYYDPLQVKVIIRILEQLVSSGLVQDVTREVGIVAPFRAMIHTLLQNLAPEFKNITIDTVERFQGSERRIIIISLPLHESSAIRNIEALSGDGKVDRKLNVAVSRAQERLIVLGCAELCRRSGHYNLLMDKIAASGKMIPYNEI